VKPVEKIEIQLVDTQSLLFGFDLSSQKSQLDLAKIAVNELKVSNPEKRTSKESLQNPVVQNRGVIKSRHETDYLCR